MTKKDLGFAPVSLPIADLRETCAEKLARFRRVMFARDVYDLHALLPLVRNGLDVIRELLLFKVYFDIVDDGRGTAPFDPEGEYKGLRAADVRGVDELGAMTGKVIDVSEMLSRLESVYGPMAPLSSPREDTIARCNRGDRYRVQQWQEELRLKYRHTD